MSTEQWHRIDEVFGQPVELEAIENAREKTFEAKL
jgi:hypothetical protein